MKYLLDTNVISETRKLHRAHPSIRRWEQSVDARDTYLSVVTIFETEMGILQFEGKDKRQAQILRSWLHTRILPAFADRILPMDASIALVSARFHVPDPCSLRDSLIAATALVHGMTVVTRNVGDFVPTGVPILNPWDA
jgi:toxin FitB